MYIVTGGAGFIGSNLVHDLNKNGITEILIVDNLKNTAKFHNLEGASFVDYLDKQQFRSAIANARLTLPKVNAIFHQGACSNTLEDDGEYMMDNNFQYSKEVLQYAIHMRCPFIYASSAAIYGLSGRGRFTPVPENERPLNVYGFSKLAFDNYVRHQIEASRVPITAVGLRYFNVYGPREQHKGRMASVINHLALQIRATGKMRLFESSGEFGNGEQRRDFVFVRDLSLLNMFFAGAGQFEANVSRRFQGVVNAGSGQSKSFNQVAAALVTVFGEAEVEFIPFPRDLKGRYQHFTEADLTGLRELGYNLPFTSLEDGIKQTFAEST